MKAPYLFLEDLVRAEAFLEGPLKTGWSLPKIVGSWTHFYFGSWRLQVLFCIYIYIYIYFLFSLVGFKGNLSLLELCLFFPGGLKQIEDNLQVPGLF